MPPHIRQRSIYFTTAAHQAIIKAGATSEKESSDDALIAVQLDIRTRVARGQNYATAVASRATRLPSAPVRWTRGPVHGAERQDILRETVLRGGRVAVTALTA